MVEWANLAERTLDANRAMRNEVYPTQELVEAGLMSPIEALRRTLYPAEMMTQHLTIGFVGQALVLLCHHWAPITDREDFLASLTTIEANLFRDAAALWQARQQLAANLAAGLDHLAQGGQGTPLEDLE
jgi:hypothetical protein